MRIAQHQGGDQLPYEQTEADQAGANSKGCISRHLRNENSGRSGLSIDPTYNIPITNTKMMTSVQPIRRFMLLNRYTVATP